MQLKRLYTFAYDAKNLVLTVTHPDGDTLSIGLREALQREFGKHYCYSDLQQLELVWHSLWELGINTKLLDDLSEELITTGSAEIVNTISALSTEYSDLATR